MRHPFAFIVFGVLCFGLFSDLSARTWTVRGEELEGDCLGCPSESLVEIQAKDEKIVVPQDWLSSEDRAFVAEQFPRESGKVSAKAEEKPQNKVSKADSAPAKSVKKQPQTAAEPEEYGESPNFWRISEHIFLGILGIGILLLLFQEGRSLRSRASKDPEEEDPHREKSKEAGELPFIGPILSGERFGYSAELEKEAETQASEWAGTVTLELEKKLEKNKHPKVERIQNMAQNIADDINWKFTQKMCAEDSFWIRKIYGENAKVPSELPGIVDNLLSPVQVPAVKQIRLDVSPYAIGIVAAVGAFFGALGLCFLANICGMKEPGDVTVLIGAALGTGLFSTFMMWVAANEGIRKWLQNALIGILVADTALTLLSLFTSFGKFFGKSKIIRGSFLKRLGLWLGALLLLRLMKQELVFDRDDYKNKLEMLFRERIQSIVMLLALYKAEKEYIISEQDKWAEKQKELEARVKGNNNVLDSMKFLVPKLKEFQKAPLSEIVRCSKVLLQEFRLLGFDIPKESVQWESDLNSLLKNASPASSAASQPVKRTFKWSEEKSEEFKVYGDPDEGEEVEVLEEPIFQNGTVFKKGIVQEIAESN